MAFFNPTAFAAARPAAPTRPKPPPGYAGAPFSMAASKPLKPPPAAPRPPTLTSYDAFPNVALARAQEAQGVANLDTQLRGQMQTAALQQGTTLDRLRQQKQLAHEDILNRLAAQGITHSGDLGHLTGLAGRAYAEQESDIRGQHLANTSQWWNNYLTQRQALRNQVINAYLKSYGSLLQNPTLLASYLGRLPSGPPPQQLVGRGF